MIKDINEFFHEAEVVDKDGNVIIPESLYEFVFERDVAVNVQLKFPDLQIWTMIDGDEDTMYLESGAHIVNVVGFAFTKKKREDAMFNDLRNDDGSVSVLYWDGAVV